VGSGREKDLLYFFITPAVTLSLPHEIYCASCKYTLKIIATFLWLIIFSVDSMAFSIVFSRVLRFNGDLNCSNL
jgi:hypothetical protein